MINPKIMSFGEVLWDLFPEGEQFGGAPANFACHVANLGGEVSMVSAVGDDPHGHSAIDILQSYGVDVSMMQTCREAATGTIGIELDEERKPTFTIHEDSAWDRLAWNDALGSAVAEADAVYFGTLGQRSEASRGTIRRALTAAATIPRVLDINLRPPFFDATLIRESIELASILKLSDDELNAVCNSCDIRMDDSSEELLKRLLTVQSLDLVIMTRGADGAVLVTPDGIVDQSGLPTTVVDTVGAGDSFTAAFLQGLLRGMPHEQNLRHACEIAAAVCTHAGAVPTRNSVGESP